MMYADLSKLDESASIRTGAELHEWVLGNIYDMGEYKDFKRRCRESGLSVNKAINLLIRDYLEGGASCVITGFKV